MDKINQTNRTILFETINPSKHNILTLIGDTNNITSLEDDKIKEINENLLVSSFEEFLDKFEPTIYSYYDADKLDICYSLEKPNLPDEVITVIKLNKENTFLNMLLSLIDMRNSNKVKNINFNYEDILEYLSPKKVIENLKQLRREIAYLYEKYHILDEKNPLKFEIGDKLNYKFEQASKNYNNVLAMLPLAINDIETRLMLDDGKKSKNRIDKIKTGILTIGSEGNIEVLAINSPTNTLQIEQNLDNSQNQLSQIFIEDYKQITNTPNDYVASLVARSFAPISTNLQEIDIEKEVVNYNNYLDLYKKSQENFIEISKELIKKILGVKLFFDQYDVKSKQMTPKLLITNISTDLLLNPKNKTVFKVYLNTVNNKNDFSNTVWFAIFPNVGLDFNIDIKNIRKRFNGRNLEDDEKNKFNTLINLANTLSEYKIQIFFNFEANDKTDFKSLALGGIEEYIEKTKVLENQEYSEYLIPVLPNFTLIPMNRSKVSIGNNIEADSQNISKQDEVFFYINGIHIDASYIAAGIVAAYQCPNYLKQRFKDAIINNPGVRVNIEAGENNFNIKTTLAKEISGYTQDLKNKINELSYGFVFTSDNAVYNNKIIDNILVYKARNMSKNKNSNYEPIYKTLTSNYIERILRYDTSDFKEERLNYFFSSAPDSTKSMWLKNNNVINSILRLEDDMTYEIDANSNTFSLNLKLSGDTRHLKLIINSKE
ncbi:transcriptional regulator [Oceanivirga salmonicida]|uniref:transcriptional regulator n=1 Tax=Oceanivirga salmonicida TaxID=1769291 RepID=UPI00082D4A12|nr:transcriptional regulator [Oceanivirga salmonicida]